jgi:hypothetical protein
MGASIIMACPNLERLLDFYPTFRHQFDRLTYALSTRRNLKDQVWIIGPTPGQAAIADPRSNIPLDPYEAAHFLGLHERWSSLESLVLSSQSKGRVDHKLFCRIFRCTPVLKKLWVSNFDEADFNDNTIQYLPDQLQSLRLENLRGVTDAGLSKFAGRPAARTLETIIFINIDIASLYVLSKLFANLTSIQKFTILQELSPELPQGEVVFQPIIAAPTLNSMHWDILVPGGADRHLAESIRANGFPNLRVLRAPSDSTGILQNCCKPVESIAQLQDAEIIARGPNLKFSRTLALARQRAQKRIEDARKVSTFKFQIEENGKILQQILIPGYMGDIASRIQYKLEPDIKDKDYAIAGIADLLMSARESQVLCDGSWNAKKALSAKGWLHTPRAVYRGNDLGLFL